MNPPASRNSFNNLQNPAMPNLSRPPSMSEIEVEADKESQIQVLEVQMTTVVLNQDIMLQMLKDLNRGSNSAAGPSQKPCQLLNRTYYVDPEIPQLTLTWR